MTDAVTLTASRTVSCRGDDGDHPLVYLHMGDSDQAVCPYCGRQFRFKADASRPASPHAGQPPLKESSS